MSGTKNSIEGLSPLICETAEISGSNILNSVEGISVEGLQSGATCYVRSADVSYRFIDTSIETPAPPAVILPVGLSPSSPGRWLLITGGGGGSLPEIPPLDNFDIIQWAFQEDQLSGSTIANLGSDGTSSDLTANDTTSFEDPSPPDVFGIYFAETLSGVSTESRHYESPAPGVVPDMSNGLTVSGWVKQNNPLGLTDRVLLKQTATTWSGTPITALSVLAGSAAGCSIVLNESSPTETVLNGGDELEAMSQGDWRHVGITINAAQDLLSLFINANLVGTVVMTGPIIWGVGPWILGNRVGTTEQRFPGNVWDWRVTETVRDREYFRNILKGAAPRTL